MSDYITGHAHRTIGAKYGAPTVEHMAAALEKLPRYEIAKRSPHSGRTRKRNEPTDYLISEKFVHHSKAASAGTGGFALSPPYECRFGANIV
jgi:hypothetical protein